MAVNLELRHPGTAKVGDIVSVGLFATATPNEAMNAAQALVEYDRSVLAVRRISRVGAVPSLMASWPTAGFYRQINDASPPTKSPFLAVWMANLGKTNAITATPGGVLLMSFVFDAIAPGTADLSFRPSMMAGGVQVASLTFSAQVAGLPITGTLTGTKVVVGA